MRTFVPLLVAAVALAGMAAPGLAAGTEPQSAAKPPEVAVDRVVIGRDEVRDETLTTKNPTQVIFADRGVLELSRGAEIVIDEFTYDRAKQFGTMTVTIRNGVFRYTGGEITRRNSVRFVTPAGTLTLRGGTVDILDTGDPEAEPERPQR